MGGGVWVFRLASLLALCFLLSGVEASLGDIDPRYRTCVRECQTTGITGENIISHCQSKENDTSVGDSWYNQEQIYVQWKQLNCMTDCRYFCMMQREGERQSLGLNPVKYHGKWPFLRVSAFQEPLSAALSAINLLMHFTGWLSFFLLVNYRLPLRPQTKRTYYEYTGLWHIYAILSMNAWLWSSIFHTRDIDLTQKLDYSSAVALLGYSLILSLLRTFNVQDEASRVMFAAPILAFVTTHILYLNFYELDYGWNMKVCVVMAVVQLLSWAIWGGVSRHPARLKIWTVVFGGALAMLLELYDFPPYMGYAVPTLCGMRAPFLSRISGGVLLRMTPNSAPRHQKGKVSEGPQVNIRSASGQISWSTQGTVGHNGSSEIMKHRYIRRLHAHVVGPRKTSSSAHGFGTQTQHHLLSSSYMPY